MVYLLSDDNAGILNEALLDYLKAHDKPSCTIIRDKGDYFALIGDLAMAEVRIADTLLPHAPDNIPALVLLRTVSTTYKGSFELDTVLRYSGLKAYWTESELAKEREERMPFQIAIMLGKLRKRIRIRVLRRNDLDESSSTLLPEACGSVMFRNVRCVPTTSRQCGSSKNYSNDKIVRPVQQSTFSRSGCPASYMYNVK